MFNKLIKKVFYTGTITLKTGLHIGGTNASLNIGGPDKFVVRNPISNIPYIPGSSLKGKMRALVEISTGFVTISEKGDVGPTNDSSNIVGKLFGTAGDGDDKHPSRLIVRDADLDVSNEDMFSNTDLPYTESKTEVAIDRVTSKANPRTFERVPAGAKFKLELVLNVFENEDEKGLKATLNQAIKLLEDDYLGGHGSRGYGQVKIELENPDGKDKTY
jgi:CRISPR-associated protein Csm3